MNLRTLHFYQYVLDRGENARKPFSLDVHDACYASQEWSTRDRLVMQFWRKWNKHEEREFLFLSLRIHVITLWLLCDCWSPSWARVTYLQCRSPSLFISNQSRRRTSVQQLWVPAIVNGEKKNTHTVRIFTFVPDGHVDSWSMHVDSSGQLCQVS